MIWLLTVSLAAGCLLAQRFRILVLAPATFVVVVAAIAVGIAQTNGVWSTILMMATASVGIQFGYFLGLLIQYGLGALLARRSSGLARRPQRGTAWPIKKPKAPPSTPAEPIDAPPAGIPRATA
jgi:membrane protein DedA with SNARE-associated domain